MTEASLETRVAAAGLDWVVPRWEAPQTVRAFVTTRNGRDRAPFDIGPARLDPLSSADRATVLASRAFVASWLPSAPVYLDQVHGSAVARLAALPDSSVPWPVADAAVTRDTDVVIAIRVADCLPVLLSDATGSVVAAAHAGWRGLAAGVLEATVQAMEVPTESVKAWIGPGIGPTAFEVGPDVRDAFVERDPASTRFFTCLRPGKWLADLPGLAALRLAAAGVEHISSSGLCTVRDFARFHSYRRDRSTGRMGAFLWRAPADTK